MAKLWKPQAPLFEQVNTMKNKIQLMDGDRKAYYDATYQKLNKEHERLIELRSQVKLLRREMQQKVNPDEFITDQALQRQPLDRKALIKYSTTRAMDMMDSQVNDTMKKLNAMQYKTGIKQDRLHDMEEEYTRLLILASDNEDIRERQGNVGQLLRDLENRLDKAFLKQNEASHVNSTYKKIKELLHQEAITYEITLEAIEKEVLMARSELEQVKVLQDDAILARNHDLVELRRHEEFVTTEMKRRELELTNMKKLAQSKNYQSIQSKVVVPMEMTFGDDTEVTNTTENPSIMIDENNLRLEQQEQLFQVIKEVTGISNLNQMVKRFQSQVNKYQSLVTLRMKLEEDILTKKSEKEIVMYEYMQIKYSIEEKSSKQTNSKSERESKLSSLKQKLGDIVMKRQENEQLLAGIRFNIEHLAIKCEKKIDRNSELCDIKFYSKLLEKISNELGLYLGEVKDYNLKEESNKIQEESDEIILIPSEFNVIVESKVNSFNTRVKITAAITKELLSTEDDSECDDKTEVLTRQALKKQSKKLLESKAKKRVTLS